MSRLLLLEDHPRLAELIRTALQGDPSALAVLLKNLVENAIYAAPANTPVTLHLAADGVRVRDHGAGIAAQHLPHLFQRFWRAPERRDAGAGLGLSICAEVAQVHGWQLAATNHEPGAEFALRFAPTAS
jgi:two-component system sensor histidine kinase QseC